MGTETTDVIAVFKSIKGNNTKNNKKKEIKHQFYVEVTNVL